MDVSDAFREAAHRAYASQSGMTPDRADALVAPRDLPPPSARSPVLKSAHDTLVLVRELRAFVTRHRADYLREGKDSDTVRDGIESEVRLSVKACQAHITMLKSTVQEVEAGKTEGVQGVAHMHGVVLILTEFLQRVAASFDQCREVRFKKVLAAAEHRRRVRLRSCRRCPLCLPRTCRRRRRRSNSCTRRRWRAHGTWRAGTCS